MLNFSFKVWSSELSKNHELQKKIAELQTLFISLAKSKQFKNIKTNAKKALDVLHSNQLLKEKFEALQIRIVDQALDHPVEHHFKNFENGVNFLLEHRSLQEAFLKFQFHLNQDQEINFNQDVVQLRELVADQIKISNADLSQTEKSKFTSIVFHLLLSLVFTNFQSFDKALNLSDIYFNYLNCIKGIAVANSTIQLRAEQSIESETLCNIPKNTLLKVLSPIDESVWVKVFVYNNELEIEGYVAKAYLKFFA